MSKEDAELLITALDNPAGVLVKDTENESVCPTVPAKEYEESVYCEMVKVSRRQEKK